MSRELSYIIQKICHQFGVSPDSVQTAPIQHGCTRRNNVWKLEMNGEQYLLKRHFIAQPVRDSVFTAAQVEASVLSTLHDAGCNVPKMVWQSHSDSYLLLEWVGASTLDDLAQAEVPQSLEKVTINAVKTFCQIEQQFVNQAHTFERYVYPLDYPSFLTRTMQTMINQGRKTVGHLTNLYGKRAPTDLESVLDTLWTNLSDRLHLSRPTLGVLDYNARNIVVHEQEVNFVDFGTIGWDWSERRIIQLFNSLGSHRSRGNFINLLDQAVVKAYTKQAVIYRGGCSELDIAAQLDYHNILFYLATIHRLVEVVTRPETEGNKQLLRAWGNEKSRLARALDTLEHCRLSDDAYANQFRTLMGRFRQEP